MTFNATFIYKDQLEATGFVELIPQKPKGKAVRRIYVTQEIWDTLNGIGPEGRKFPTVVSEALITKFCAGWAISVSERSAEKTDFEKLEGLDEVWAMCFRKPGSGSRLLGRMIAENVFVGLQLYERGFLASRERYNRIAGEIIPNWQALLPSIEPFRATSLSEYLGENIFNQDEA